MCPTGSSIRHRADTEERRVKVSVAVTMENEHGRGVVACALGDEALTERRQRWQALGARAGIDIVSTDSGLRLIFRADRGVEEELRELAALERHCCAFADWSVRLRDGKVVLDIRGESDVAAAAVQEMFRSHSRAQTA
jgi:hypothetical protein